MVATASLAVVATVPVAGDGKNCGDANGDGKADLVDVTSATKRDVGSPSSLNDETKRVDPNGDGKTDLRDVAHTPCTVVGSKAFDVEIMVKEILLGLELIIEEIMKLIMENIMKFMEFAIEFIWLVIKFLEFAIKFIEFVIMFIIVDLNRDFLKNVATDRGGGIIKKNQIPLR